MAQAAAPAPSGHAAPAAVEEAPKAVPPSEWVTSYGAEMAKHMFTDNKRLISTVCRRRLLDYEFAFSDKIDPNSTMRKLCTEKEVKDVVRERLWLFERCIEQKGDKNFTTPYLYNPSK